MLCLLLLPVLSGCADADAEVNAARYQKALEAYYKKELPVARELLNEIADSNPDFPGARVMQGKILYHDQDYEAAFEKFTSAYEADGTDLNALLGIVRCRRIQGQTEEALQAVNDFVRRDSGNIEAWYLKGQAHESLGQIDDAIAAYEYGLSEGKKQALLHLRLEELYRNGGLTEKAARHRSHAVWFLGGTLPEAKSEKK
jgi:tetratricopeptide (TPR) repeat protein